MYFSRWIWLFLATSLFLPQPSSPFCWAGEAPAGAEKTDSPSFIQTAGTWLFHHTEIGTRMTAFKLNESRRHYPDHFYGSITELREKQNIWPMKCFIDLTFNQYIGIEATWDQIQADTISAATDGHNDGTIDLTGPIVSLFGRYPIARFVPYAGIGLMMIYSSFDPEDHWRYRGLSPDSEYEQVFDFKNTTVPVYYGGLGVQFNKSWSAEVYVRYIEVELNGTHYFTEHGVRHDETRKVEIPMSNIGGGLGIRYAF